MSLEVEATYENGVLKPDEPLPFKDRERILITVKSKTSRVDESYGLIAWTGGIRSWMSWSSSTSSPISLRRCSKRRIAES